jgi:L-threonylcarbamoyladenylate synthase
MTHTSSYSENAAEVIHQAAERLQHGGLVAFPTETVYGLGADAENPQAVARIYQAKGRPSSHPVIVHVAPGADISYWAAHVPSMAHRLIDAFWPGPLTLILKRAAHIPAQVAGGQDTIGLRCPSHPVAQALLTEFARLKPNGQGGVAAPSANKFGQVSPTQASHVKAEFPDLPADQLLILEGGASQVGIESTILDLSRLDQGVGPVLLRPGHITQDQIADVLGEPVLKPDADAPRVSGSLKAHYAPHTPVQLISRQDLPEQARSLATQGIGVIVVAFDPSPYVAMGIDAIACSTEPAVYARELYALLRYLDTRGHDRILVEQPPQNSAWQAINDRLGRAAAAFQ